jgi:hypothetical protein
MSIGVAEAQAMDQRASVSLTGIDAYLSKGQVA